MKKMIFFCLLLNLTPSFAQISSAALAKNPLIAMDIVIEPSKDSPQQYGTLLLSLYGQQAPISSRNFLNYVEDHYYDGLLFHRMIPQFMIQGGGFTPNMKQKTSGPPITNEASKKLPNVKGSIAMARTMDINSATSQFFINFRDNHFLDHMDESDQGFGYAVFGQVVSGLDWLESLQQLPTHQVTQYADVPSRQIIIKKIRVLAGAEKQQALASIEKQSIT